MTDLSKIKMNLLNDEESAAIKGGKTTTCNKSGDTIACNLATKILACAYEVKCEGDFSSSCNGGTFTISGCTKVTFT